MWSVIGCCLFVVTGSATGVCVCTYTVLASLSSRLFPFHTKHFPSMDQEGMVQLLVTVRPICPCMGVRLVEIGRSLYTIRVA